MRSFSWTKQCRVRQQDICIVANVYIYQTYASRLEKLDKPLYYRMVLMVSDVRSYFATYKSCDASKRYQIYTLVDIHNLDQI